MSASLLLDMPISKVNSTLQILSEHGVDQEDLRFLRTYRKGFARYISNLIKEGRQLFEDAAGGHEETALFAVNHITDDEILQAVYSRTRFVSVAVAVMERLTDGDQIFHLIRINSEEWRMEANLVGARKLSKFYLYQLSANDGYQNPRVLSWRRELVKEILFNRGENC